MPGQEYRTARDRVARPVSPDDPDGPSRTTPAGAAPDPVGLPRVAEPHRDTLLPYLAAFALPALVVVTQRRLVGS